MVFFRDRDAGRGSDWQGRSVERSTEGARGEWEGWMEQGERGSDDVRDGASERAGVGEGGSREGGSRKGTSEGERGGRKRAEKGREEANGEGRERGREGTMELGRLARKG